MNMAVEGSMAAMNDELDTMQVFGESKVGWCEHTPTNESMDDDGNPVLHSTGFSSGDPTAPKRRAYDDPEVCRLREHLRANNGLRGLEIVQPHEVERAARIFFRDGFVVVRDLLDPAQLARFREGSARVLRDILSLPGHGGRKYITETNRLPHRYSYGTASASRQLLHDPVWASMIDLPTTTPILEAIFGSRDFSVLGAGGDLSLPGAMEYQVLHSDLAERFELPPERIEQARALGLPLRTRKGSEQLDARSAQLAVERTPPVVTINFLMCDLTPENGPIRQIPATQARADLPPSQADEPMWMRLSTLVGAPAGAGVFRDNRAWHGATPNLSREVRAMPNVEYGAPWLMGRGFARTMPHAVWETLSPHAQHIARYVKAEPGVWPAGAGSMHPIAAARKRAQEAAS
jgi:hypothetical protein